MSPEHAKLFNGALSDWLVMAGVCVNPPLHQQKDSVAGITPAELAASGGRLEAFAADILESLPVGISAAAASATCAG